jgi:hypothetical protein
MKKKFVILFFLTFSLVSDSVKISDKLKDFCKDFNTYYPHPSWMMKQYFLKLDLSEVGVAFRFLVTNLYRISYRWHYLYDDPEQFKDDLHDRKDFLKHFKKIDAWLSKIAVDQNDNSLIVLEKELDIKGVFLRSGRRLLLLKEHLRSKVSDAVADFYALYYKYLSEEFFDQCKEFTSKRCKDYSLARKKIYKLFSLIEKVLTKSLLGTNYEKDAMYQFDRYELILTMLG